MRLFETGFRIFIFALIISESAVDLEYLISQTEVIWLFFNLEFMKYEETKENYMFTIDYTNAL
eukprot:UN25987